MSSLNRRMAEAQARAAAAHRKASMITAAVMLPLVMLAFTFARSMNIRFGVTFWILCTVVVGGVLYAVVNSFLDPD